MECEVPRELPTTRCDNPAALEATCARIEALSVVNGRVLFLPKHNQGVGRIKVNVWCRSSHESSRDKQPYVDLNNRKAGDDGAVPTWDVAAQKLLTLIETKHVGCVEAAQAARMAAAAQSTPASGSSSGTRSEPSVDALQAMMRLNAAKQAAAAANAAVVAAERAREAAEAEVEAYERALGKRPRTETETEAEGPTIATDDWDYADHRRETTRVMNRRVIEIGSNETERELRTGKDGYLHHSRTGLVGAVAYWALGSTALAVIMIVALIVHLKVVDKVRAALPEGKRERQERRAKFRPHLKPGNYASVQARERWSTAEEVHLRPGHHWVFELGNAGGEKGSCEKTFKLARRTWEMYKVGVAKP